jgi:hypothetical protein
MGYQQRTEFNKRILKFSENAGEIPPQVGFLHYGVLKKPYCAHQGFHPRAGQTPDPYPPGHTPGRTCRTDADNPVRERPEQAGMIRDESTG